MLAASKVKMSGSAKTKKNGELSRTTQRKRETARSLRNVEFAALLFSGVNKYKMSLLLY